MGVESDPMAVVDSKGRVFGVSGLRVADASSFALLPPGHPESTVCESIHDILYCMHGLTFTDVVAEKIAADIIRDAKNSA